MLSVRDVDHMNTLVERKAATALVIEMTNFEKSPPTSIRILFPSSGNPHTPSFLFGTKQNKTKTCVKGEPRRLSIAGPIYRLERNRTDDSNNDERHV